MPTLKVMTYNVHRCVGSDGRADPHRIARVIEDHEPDIIALQECDVNAAKTGGVDQPHEIAKYLQMDYHFHPSITVEEEQYGNAVLSRYPLRNVKAGPLPRYHHDIFARFAGIFIKAVYEERGCLWVAADVQGVTVQFMTTHLGLLDGERRRQFEMLLSEDWLGHSDFRAPAVFLGDLNAGYRHPAFGVMRRRYRLQGAQAAAPGASKLNTYSSRCPFRAIDHIMVKGDMRIRSCNAPRTRLAREASDHLPLIAEIEL